MNFYDKKNKTRRKRDASVDEVPSLNTKERKSLLEAYKSFEKLSDEQRVLLNRLKEVEALSHHSLKIISKPKSSDLIRNLNRIGWSSAPKIQIIHPHYKGEPKVSPSRKNSFNWSSWDKNPYKLFFDREEDFFKLVDGVNKAKQEYESYMRSKRAASVFAMICGDSCQRSIFREKPSYQKKIDNAENSVDMVIVSQLLNWMNFELNKNS